MESFDAYRSDLAAQGYEDTLDVFRKSPVLCGVQSAQITQAQELHNALVDSLQLRQLDAAQGENLDAIGRIVGLSPRPFVDAADIAYFAPDVVGSGPDGAPVYVTGGATSGQNEVGDTDYRSAIRVKIAKNAIKYGSPAELAYFARAAWGITLSVRNVGLSEVLVTVPPGTPGRIVAELVKYRTDETADLQYSLPVPTTTHIRGVFIRTPLAFAPDREYCGPDIAPIGVSYHG